ncbi:MAG TPA: polysaccharide biosynthesis/export family protein [Chthoniobacteraceae bacterium]|nr:polysaccharide biosynthesis/export family protein [Chthoniobacteraceae bacterium]
MTTTPNMHTRFDSRHNMVLSPFTSPTVKTMGYIRAFILAFSFFAIALAGHAFAAPGDEVPDPDKALGPGDTVSFQIAEDNVAPVKIRVTDGGQLTVPYIGNVSVSGKSCSEVAANVKNLLENKYKYYRVATVKVSIEQVAPAPVRPPWKVNVFGKVANPTLIEVPSGTTLSIVQAISKAGGPTPYGDLGKVKFTRKGVVTVINVKKIVENGAQDVPLQDGDTIMVPARTIVLTN